MKTGDARDAGKKGVIQSITFVTRQVVEAGGFPVNGKGALGDWLFSRAPTTGSG
jgi:hypothetical protein